MLTARQILQIAPILLGFSLPSSAILRQALADEVSDSAAMSELKLRRAEPMLLHRLINLDGLRVLKEALPNGTKEALGWKNAPPLGQGAKLLIVHLWAVECSPCVAELPVLRDIVQGIQNGPLGRQARFIFLTETQEDGKLAQFLAQHRADLPSVQLYRAEQQESSLRASLQTDIQPVTLLVEPSSRGPIVRHAILGSIKERRSELANALTRLVQFSK